MCRFYKTLSKQTLRLFLSSVASLKVPDTDVVTIIWVPSCVVWLTARSSAPAVHIFCFRKKTWSNTSLFWLKHPPVFLLSTCLQTVKGLLCSCCHNMSRVRGRGSPLNLSCNLRNFLVISYKIFYSKLLEIKTARFFMTCSSGWIWCRSQNKTIENFSLKKKTLFFSDFLTCKNQHNTEMHWFPPF